MMNAKDLADQLIDRAKNLQEFCVPAMTRAEAESRVDAWLNGQRV